MRIILVLAVVIFMVVGIIYGFRFAMKDVMSMYAHPKKPVDDEHYRRNILLAELARLDQQIVDAEELTTNKCDDTTLRRATEMLAEARERRREVEAQLTAAR